MKTRITFLAALLMLAVVLQAEIFVSTVDMKITAVDAAAGTVTVSSRGKLKTYQVRMTTSLTVNGKPALFRDLLAGMQVNALMLLDSFTINKLDAIREDKSASSQNAKSSQPQTIPDAKESPKASPSASPVPISTDTQHTAAEVIKTNHNDLVFVTGKEGAGSGFIANMDGATYLVTNAHVAAGISDADFKTLDGTVVKGGAATVAVGHDIFRMALPAGGKPFEIMKGVDENAGVGDDVVVLGNAEGSGVINTIIGKIVGIGPTLVEIDAQFVPGNSGSPIVHLKTGKVIGVATYTITQKYDATTKEKMKAPVVRRFGYRLDSVKTWQTVNWPTFYAQANAMEKIHTLTEDLGDFFRDLAENKGAVTIGRHTNPIIKTRIDQWQESKGRGHSLIDRQNANANFLSFLKVACQSDINGIQRYLTYDYFQRRLAEEQQARTEMSQAFSDIIKENRE
jgi:S1-C subfamily serine protease